MTAERNLFSGLIDESDDPIVLVVSDSNTGGADQERSDFLEETYYEGETFGFR